MKEKIILIGGGGHCESCIDVIEAEAVFEISGIVDVAQKLHEKILGYEIIATDDDLPRLVNEHENFLITMGQIKSAEKRINIFRKLKKNSANLPTIISPLAYVSRHALVGEGTIAMHGAIINAGAKIGMNCIINNKALIEHGADIGDHCHIATGANVNGNVHIGDGSFIGSGVITKQGIHIGKNCVIGAGCIIKENITDNQIRNR